MRMWNVERKMLCNRHLQQEHASMHLFASAIVKGRSISTYINRGHCACSNILHRHNVLAREMLDRGMRHLTPMDSNIKFPAIGVVDAAASVKYLTSVCSACATLRREMLNRREIPSV